MECQQTSGIPHFRKTRNERAPRVFANKAREATAKITQSASRQKANDPFISIIYELVGWFIPDYGSIRFLNNCNGGNRCFGVCIGQQFHVPGERRHLREMSKKLEGSSSFLEFLLFLQSLRLRLLVLFMVFGLRIGGANMLFRLSSFNVPCISPTYLFFCGGGFFDSPRVNLTNFSHRVPDTSLLPFFRIV